MKCDDLTKIANNTLCKGEDNKMSLTILNTNSENNDYINLIKLLDKDLNERYGELQKTI